jgi:hypothetical protein
MFGKYIPLFNMIKCVSFLSCIIISASMLAQDLKSPEVFLGIPKGEKQTPHHQILAYFKYCNEQFPSLTKLIPYGKTGEGRTLLVMVVGSAENIARLEEIKQNNLIKAQFIEGTIKGKMPVIVWLSHSIHGDESSGAESSMYTLFELLNSKNTKTQAWLTNTIVVLDVNIL